MHRQFYFLDPKSVVTLKGQLCRFNHRNASVKIPNIPPPPENDNNWQKKKWGPLRETGRFDLYPGVSWIVDNL